MPDLTSRVPAPIKPHRFVPDAASRGKMTLARLAKMHKAGLGAGRLENYIPWQRIRRHFSSPVSNQYLAHLANWSRPLQLLAGTEYRTALLAAYLGATEIREQFPMGTEAHPHPGIDADQRIPTRVTRYELPGIRDLARQAGIDPGRYPGTDITYVPTVDLLLAVPGESGYHTLHAWPVKPRGLLTGRGADRRLERLELERRWASAADIRHQLMCGDEVPQQLYHNLDAYMPLPSERERLARTTKLHDFACRLVDLRETRDLHSAVLSAAAYIGIDDRKTAHLLFRVAFWEGLTDIDLTKPVMWREQATHGGGRQRGELRRKLLGINA